ncbi:hypothetical protein M3J09_009573 [Ascochyta lentis]
MARTPLVAIANLDGTASGSKPSPARVNVLRVDVSPHWIRSFVFWVLRGSPKIRVFESRQHSPRRSDSVFLSRWKCIKLSQTYRSRSYRHAHHQSIPMTPITAYDDPLEFSYNALHQQHARGRR